MPETKVVLITGADGGLGRALVGEFAVQGWRVVAASRRKPAESAAERIWPAAMDVTDREQIGGVMRQVIARWSRLDVLVNNAGVSVDRPLWLLSPEEWDSVLEVNLRGAFLCTQAALGPMTEQRDGHIINVASFAARHGPRGQANYAAAKAALLGLTLALAKEAGGFNVRVNAVLPGVLLTPMTAGLGPGKLAEFAADNALGRINSLAEVARFLAFLATLQNVSGQVFQLDSRIARWT